MTKVITIAIMTQSVINPQINPHAVVKKMTNGCKNTHVIPIISSVSPILVVQDLHQKKANETKKCNKHYNNN